MDEPIERWYSVSALAKRWQVSRSSVYRYIRMGYLKTSVLGARIVVTSSQANDFIRKLESGQFLSDNSKDLQSDSV